MKRYEGKGRRVNYKVLQRGGRNRKESSKVNAIGKRRVFRDREIGEGGNVDYEKLKKELEKGR